jgi:flagellin
LNNKSLSGSLEKLSSGLRINKASDDASGMAIADKLRAQSNSLGQAIKNANDAVGVIQIADKAMDEQVKILDTIKTKATQAAQDGQTKDTRKALQADISKLLEALDNIATTTSYNGQSLLNGSYTNKSFQVGAYSNQTVDFSVGSTHSSKIGAVRFETYDISAGATGTKTLTFNAVDGVNNVTLESVEIGTQVGEGIGAVADVINKNSDSLGGVKASWTNVLTTTAAISGGDITGLAINGVTIGNVDNVLANDSDGKLVNAINNITDQTGIEASLDEKGGLVLRSTDGRAISAAGLNGATSFAASISGYGNLTLQRAGGQDIVGVSATFATIKESSINLGDMKGSVSKSDFSAMGGFANSAQAGDVTGTTMGSGVTTLTGAMAMMEIAESAISMLNKIRSNMGSTQNQLTATINNISVTQVNVTAAESQIRDVDFASESASFQKYNILAQAGSYALSQANQLSQNIQRLLQ